MPVARPTFAAARLAAGLLAAAVAGTARAAPAPSDGAVERTVLQRTELPGTPARVMVMTELRAEPGARIPRHTHPGTEMVYVLTAGRTRTDGGDVREMGPGQTLQFDRGEVHGGFTVIGERAVRALTVHVVDADKPMTTVVD
jgi:quercetin dioxygenase-like cupin family protein